MFQVVEIYSEYINNFSCAMELVRLEAKRLTLYVSRWWRSTRSTSTTSAAPWSWRGWRPSEEFSRG